MKLLLLISILAAVAALAAAVVIALYRHKRASTGDFALIGETAQVNEELAPEGTVLVNGELWRAKSKSGATISAQTLVQVVGFENHLMLVEVSE